MKDLQGVGRGIARTLAQCGARVFVTGRSMSDREVVAEHGHFDVTTLWTHKLRPHLSELRTRRKDRHSCQQCVGWYERMVEDGIFTWTKPFWEQPLWRWDAMFGAGVRAHYYGSQLAANS